MRVEQRMRLFIGCIGLMIMTMPVAFAQEAAVVKSHFESDSISIGKSVPYSLTARYPRDKQVLFPDSTFSFAPFEISRKKFFPTKSDGQTSFDSVVYYLTTFEIDSVQRLKLPVFILQEKDCVNVFSPTDSISLSFRVASMPDSVSVEKLPLKTNTAYQKVSWLLNYPILLGAVLILIILAIATWVIFGKRIRKYFALKRLHKEYQQFVAVFNSSVSKLSAGFTSRRAEDALIIWKKYMEDLESSPYTKFTSREIVRLVNDQQLEGALRTIDRGIYGGYLPTVDTFEFLQNYSQKRFQKKETEVKNG
ncbi:hypothetical protein BH09BAC3_BH09BAC3_09430 [soil metagenome]